jgi:hypothetical protein
VKTIQAPVIKLAAAAILLVASWLILIHPIGADIRPARGGGQIAADWNKLAYDIAFAEDQLSTFKGLRAMAMMHLAMHNALNTIKPTYERYEYSSGAYASADPAVAAAQAAHDVLLSQYPGERTRIDAALMASVAGIKASAGKSAGSKLGNATAAAILDRRKGDGWDTKGDYKFINGPGFYRTTPPWNGFVLQPGFGSAKPFALFSGHQFQPSPPPSLTSVAYAEAFNEVKAFGSKGSKVRTADQTAYAVWWMEFSEGSVNRLARRLVQERQIDLWAANRMFAEINMALFDVYVAVWNSKYEVNHWRPYTAIREAAGDGNDATSPQPDWEPLRPTPPFPEYVSAHAAGCAAAFGILGRTIPENRSFKMETLTAPPGMPVRSFSSFEEAAAECADSRVRLGWHYRYSVIAGTELGAKVAGFVWDKTLRKAR